MKPLQTLWTVTRKLCRKISFTILDRSKITFNWLSIFFDRSNKNRVVIKTSKNSRIFSLPFRLIEPKLWPIEIPGTWIFTKKIPKFKFLLYSFYKWRLSNLISLLQLIHVCTYIYNNKLVFKLLFVIGNTLVDILYDLHNKICNIPNITPCQ